MSLDSRNAAIVLGVIFILVGILGFVPNPIVAPDGIFAVNPLHNIIHLVSGLVLLLGAYTALGSVMGLRIIGVIYALVAIAGFVMSGPMLLGMVAMNMADQWLHVVLAIVLLAAGFGLPGAKPAA